MNPAAWAFFYVGIIAVGIAAVVPEIRWIVWSDRRLAFDVNWRSRRYNSNVRRVRIIR